MDYSVLNARFQTSDGYILDWNGDGWQCGSSDVWDADDEKHPIDCFGERLIGRWLNQDDVPLPGLNDGEGKACV